MPAERGEYHHKQPKEDAKMRALILYVAQRYEDDPAFGSTKLNKVLFHADFSAYAKLGDSLTRYEYRAEEEGPVLYAMKPVLDEMAKDDRIKPWTSWDWAHPQDRITALEDPNMALFSPEERQIIDESIERLSALNADQLSDQVHKFPGWIHAWQKGSGTTIPYESVFWERRDYVTSEQNARAQELAREFNLPAS